MISLRLIGTVVMRPGLWGEAARTLFAMAPHKWWQKSPYVPIPDEQYTSWRLATAHGDSNTPLTPEELVAFLTWRRAQHRPLRRI